MKWNKCTIRTKTGFTHEVVMGDWLKPGEYSFGYVSITEELGDAKSNDYFKVEQDIYDMWYEDVLAKVISP